jgi:NAD(P)H-hydrate epimerase
MKILSAAQIREWDAYTIANEPIASIDLMERAAMEFADHCIQSLSVGQTVHIFCGTGNNGGDGLAVSRLILHAGFDVNTYILKEEALSPDNAINLERLRVLPKAKIRLLKAAQDFPVLFEDSVVIDALFGIGLSRPAEGLNAELIQHINQSGAEVVSVDIPSGLFCDQANEKSDAVVMATRTLTFGCRKLSFFLCENAKYTGQVEVLDIGLRPEYLEQVTTTHYHLTHDKAAAILQPRERCGHKGDYGHALMVAGSYGKMGAALLSGEACLRAGAGLLTMHIPKCGYAILQTALPEAMAETAGKKKISAAPGSLERYRSIGIGPGIGTHRSTAQVLKDILDSAGSPLVLDADALNILSQNKEWLTTLLPDTILTPHPKEFVRLSGVYGDEWTRMEAARKFAKEFKCILILKGGYTSIHFPDGITWFNTTGNPGMATGGSGDVLTGILTGLLAQGYSPQHASLLGVYLHGLAGDIAAEKIGQWSMLASDLIHSLGWAFQRLQAD